MGLGDQESATLKCISLSLSNGLLYNVQFPVPNSPVPELVEGVEGVEGRCNTKKQ